MTLPHLTSEHTPGAEAELIQRLRQRIEQLEQVQARLQESQQADQVLAQLAEQMRWQSEQSIRTWADQLLHALMPHVQGLQAALYMAQDQATTFEAIGSFAASSPTIAPIEAGVGLPGEAVKTGTPVYLKPDTEVKFLAPTGLAQVQGQALLLQPLVYNDVTEGLLELVLLRELDPARERLIQSVARMLGAHLSTVRNQVRIQRLYNEAHTQREQLVAQEEEMRQNLEELEATQEEMRRSQQLAQERQDLMNSLMNNNQDTIIAVDRDFRVILFNRQLQQNYEPLGLQVSLGMSVWSLLPAEQHGYYRGLYDRALAGEAFAEPIHYQMDGLDIHFDTQYFPLRMANGAIIGAASVARNVSEQRQVALRLAAQQKQLEETLELQTANQEHLERMTKALQAEHARFERIARNLEGMIYQYELVPATGEHGFVYVSQRSQDMFGVAPEALAASRSTGASVDIHPDDLESFASTFGQSAQTLGHFHWVGRIKNPQGEYRWIQADSVPSLTEEGHILWDGYMVDVTARIERGEFAVDAFGKAIPAVEAKKPSGAGSNGRSNGSK